MNSFTSKVKTFEVIKKTIDKQKKKRYNKYRKINLHGDGIGKH